VEGICISSIPVDTVIQVAFRVNATSVNAALAPKQTKEKAARTARWIGGGTQTTSSSSAFLALQCFSFHFYFNIPFQS
jgi:hypothetical protein